MEGLDPVLPTSWLERLLSRAEEWIYDLNDRGHWLFDLYDWGNEIWARVYFARLRERVAKLDVRIEGREADARFRLLTPEDTEDFVELLSGFDFEYLPPHPIDREGATRALRRASYLPFGIYHDGELFCYLLLRLFFPRRVVLGYWAKASHQARGFSTNAIRCAGRWSRREGLDHYITVPLDNIYSLRSSVRGGWKIIRTNSRFHVLLYDPTPEDAAVVEPPWRDSAEES